MSDEKSKKVITEITDEFEWWLGKKRPFKINDEYMLELIFIDKKNLSAKIKITNLKEKKDDGRSIS